MRRIILALSAILLAGCAGQPAPRPALTPHFTSSAALRDALVKAGLDCTGYSTGGRRGFGEEDASDAASCTVLDEPVSIAIWKDEGSKKDWAELDTKLGCEFAFALARPVPAYVDGGTWTVSAASPTLTTTIARAIGGEVKRADCRPFAQSLAIP